jgi:hypothetical protein
MTKVRKASAIASALAAVALALPLSSPASAATYQEEIEFATDHPCTREIVEGDTTVRMTINTTSNPDGTQTVQVIQHTHGQQLLGVVSQDWYVFNEGENTNESFTLVGPSGSISTRTTFIHTSEDLAYQEVPGMDDFHQRLLVTFTPLLPPTIVRDTGECK